MNDSFSEKNKPGGTKVLQIQLKQKCQIQDKRTILTWILPKNMYFLRVIVKINSAQLYKNPFYRTKFFKLNLL